VANQRSDLSFKSNGQQCSAWLYLPDARASPYSAVIMAHGLGAVKEMRLDAIAEKFQAAGYACLAFDYRHFGSSEGEPRQLLDIKRQLQDWTAAIHYARTRPELDGNRLVLWGTSFSGGHVLEAALADTQIAAVVTQGAFTDGLASLRAMQPSALLKLSALALLDIVGSWFGRAPRMVAIAGQPGQSALMTAADAEPGYMALVPEGLSFRAEVAARIAMHIPFYYPGHAAQQLQCPTLFCICDNDTVAPAAATLHHARKAPRGEIKCYPVGHFDIYHGSAFDQVIADQLAFLKSHVPPAPILQNS
jgi:pimeloyl-ACP methyl ester carboxylesterase